MKRIFLIAILLVLVDNAQIMAERDPADAWREQLRSYLDSFEKKSNTDEKPDDKDSILGSLMQNQDNRPSSEHLTDVTTSTSKTEQVPIAVFNAATYRVSIIINYVLNDTQEEEAPEFDVYPGEEREILISFEAIYIRVRIFRSEKTHTKMIVDDQIPRIERTDGFCYIITDRIDYRTEGECRLSFEGMDIHPKKK